MGNPVVEQILRSFSEKEFTTLRFNFRGTGKSTGMFDNCVGEQDDVRAALLYLKDFGVKNVYLAGYSFGARVNASVVAAGYELKDHVMVSPPMGFISFDDVAAMPSTNLIVTGEKDDIAPQGMVQAAINRWAIHPQFEVIQGCDHFYTGCLPRLNTILLDYLS
jgi:alpha/beta superfamily hydrolase